MHAETAQICVFCNFYKKYYYEITTYLCITVSGSKKRTKTHPNTTFPLRYHPNRASGVDKPGHQRAPCDWHSFVVVGTLWEMVKTHYLVKLWPLQNSGNHRAPTGSQVYQL